MDIEGSLRLDRTAVIVVQGQRQGLSIVAPSRTRAVLLHFQRIGIAHGQETVLIRTRTVRDGKYHASVIGSIIISPRAIGDANLYVACFARGLDLTVQHAAVSRKHQPFGQRALDHLKIPIIIMRGIVSCASDTRHQIERDIVLHNGGRDFKMPFSNPFQCRRLCRILKNRLVAGRSVKIAKNEFTGIHCASIRLDPDVFVVCGCCGHCVGVCVDRKRIAVYSSIELNSTALGQRNTFATLYRTARVRVARSVVKLDLDLGRSLINGQAVKSNQRIIFITCQGYVYGDISTAIYTC